MLFRSAAALLLTLGSASSAIAQSDPQAQTPPSTAVLPSSQPVVVGPAPAPPPPTYAYATAAGPAQPYARQDVPPQPGSGTGFLVAGWILLGVGAANLLTSPICVVDEISGNDEDFERVCLGFSLGLGVAGLVIGIPMLVIGYERRSNVLKWREQYGEQYGALPGLLRHVRLSLTPGAAQVGWHAAF